VRVVLRVHGAGPVGGAQPQVCFAHPRSPVHCGCGGAPAERVFDDPGGPFGGRVDRPGPLVCVARHDTTAPNDPRHGTTADATDGTDRPLKVETRVRILLYPAGMTNIIEIN